MSLVVIPIKYAVRPGIRIQKQWLPQIIRICHKFHVTVSSGYRPAGYNRMIGGAPNSDHIRGDACDFVGTPANQNKLRQWAIGKFPYVEPEIQAVNHVHISFRHLGDSSVVTPPPPGNGGGNGGGTTPPVGTSCLLVLTMQLAGLLGLIEGVRWVLS